MIKTLILIWFFVASPFAYADSARRDALLAGADGYDLALPFQDFTPQELAAETTRLEGRLHLDMTALSGGFQQVLDTYGVADNPDTQVRVMPDIDVELVQLGRQIIPLDQGLIETRHPYFDLIFTPGTTWTEADGRRFISLPFALMEKNANCIHNGALLVAVTVDGQASRALMQVGSETCAYFQFNFWGQYAASWQASELEGADEILADHRQHLAAQLPKKAIEGLTQDIDITKFSQVSEIALASMSAFGLVLDGVHYRSGCDTRLGPYPHCETMVLPSYSLAKSLAGGLGLLRLDALYGNVSSRPVSSLIPACAGWDDVSLLDLLNMSTGRFESRAAHSDEASEGFAPFFTLTEGAPKTAFSCEHFKPRAKPGSRWVYHTSDTYLLGVAMNAYLEHEEGLGADYYRDHLLPIWRELHLSPLLSVMRRTAGSDAEPFTGYGMAFTADDIARLAHLLARGDEGLSVKFDQAGLAAAMQRNTRDRGLEAGGKTLRYKNGFWAWNARESLGCGEDTWLPFFSGFGGITVVLLPGGNVYYYFSDSGVHKFAEPVKALSAVTPICGATR
ncbi:serine hydrolase [Kordiimonas sp.]|uniref:serine hydrolase n=1 Tax=Kordiimonas sp. TaxID=1970157 RepID=UPI003A91E980